MESYPYFRKDGQAIPCPNYTTSVDDVTTLFKKHYPKSCWTLTYSDGKWSVDFDMITDSYECSNVIKNAPQLALLDVFIETKRIGW